jgi:hypothetical protein
VVAGLKSDKSPNPFQQEETKEHVPSTLTKKQQFKQKRLKLNQSAPEIKSDSAKSAMIDVLTEAIVTQQPWLELLSAFDGLLSEAATLVSKKTYVMFDIAKEV